jgi:DNA-3-methyladenine glycosylase
VVTFCLSFLPQLGLLIAAVKWYCISKRNQRTQLNKETQLGVLQTIAHLSSVI